MKQFIISANYRDRNDKSRRWLVREKGAPLFSAIAVKSVEAESVEFAPSDAPEQGFGCRRVAIASGDVIWEAGEEPPVPLRFDGTDFVDSEGEIVEKVKRLTLGADGSMLAVL
jgi:hypothetical protein